MLETFQRECVEPPPIRISSVKHKAHSFTLSIKWKQPTYYSVGNWEARILKILRGFHGWRKQAPVPEVKQRHGIMPKDRIWCKRIMEMESQSANKYLQNIPAFLGVTSCNGLSNRLILCLHTEPCATKCQEEKQSSVSSCTQWWEHRARKVLSNQAFLLWISRHRAEGGKWDGLEQQTSFELGWGSAIWEDKGEAGERVARRRCKVLLEFRMFASQYAPCHRNTVQRIRDPLSLSWMLKQHLHCLFHHQAITTFKTDVSSGLSFNSVLLTKPM